MEHESYLLAAGMELFFALISLILLLGCLLDHDRKRKTNQLMIAILILNTIMNVVDACIWIWSDVPEALLYMKVLNFISYILGSTIIALFSFLLVTYIRENTPVWPWVDKVILITSILMSALWILSSFNHMYYYWDADGVYQLGPLHWLSQLFGFLIFLFNIVLVLCFRTELGRKDTAILILYNVIPLLSFFLIPVWDVTPLYCALTIVLLLYYIILHAEHGQRIAEQESMLFKQELELEQSRTAIVLSQIRPHFIYNSLSAIAQLCERNPKKAKETTLQFSDYIRQNMKSLDYKGPIPFEDELNHAKNYLSIEKVRFGEDLTIVYHIEVTDFMIPPLSLQPIVENAVKHGMRGKEDGITVTVTTKETTDHYIIIVADDGAGFHYTEALQEDPDHAGMRLVRIRLMELVHGTLEVESEPSKGTTVTITIPKNEIERR